jgi:hypothetical protein
MISAPQGQYQVLMPSAYLLLSQIYLPSFLAFVVLDGIWIGLVASDFYMSRWVCIAA